MFIVVWLAIVPSYCASTSLIVKVTSRESHAPLENKRKDWRAWREGQKFISMSQLKPTRKKSKLKLWLNINNNRLSVLPLTHVHLFFCLSVTLETKMVVSIFSHFFFTVGGDDVDYDCESYWCTENVRKE